MKVITNHLPLALMVFSVLSEAAFVVRAFSQNNSSTIVEAKFPKSAREFYDRGASLAKAHEYDKAIRDLGEAIALAPNLIEAYGARALCYYETLEFDKAIADLNSEVKLNGTNAEIFSTRGAVRRQMGEYDMAIDDLGRAINLDGASAILYFNRAALYQLKEKYDDALNDFNLSIQLDPKNADAYKARGSVYNAKGLAEKAADDLDECLKRNPTDVQALNWRAEMYVASGQYNSAVGYYYEIIRLKPADPLAYNKLAWLHATCANPLYRDGRKAIKDAAEACELTAWSKAEYIDTLAAAHAESGEFQKAVEFEKRALELIANVNSASVDLTNAMKSRLTSYKNRMPYREGECPDKGKSETVKPKNENRSELTNDAFGGKTDSDIKGVTH